MHKKKCCSSKCYKEEMYVQGIPWRSSGQHSTEWGVVSSIPGWGVKKPKVFSILGEKRECVKKKKKTEFVFLG